MPIDTVSILDGNTFVVSDRRGDLEASPTDPHGLFLNDTRFLSRWILTIDGLRPALLSVDEQAYFRVQFFLALTTGTVYVDSHLSVIRRRSIGGGFKEEIEIINHDKQPIDLKVSLEAASDFADLFEVKDKLEKRGQFYNKVEDGKLRIGYQRDSFRRETLISSSVQADIHEGELRFGVHLEPQSRWSTTLEVSAVFDRAVRTARPRSKTADEVERWVAAAPRLISNWEPLGSIYRRSLVDLAALRFATQLTPGAIPAAGLPFLILLEEYERWTGDRGLALELQREARAAIGWIDHHGDRDGDGYVEYERRNEETGLDNQCWKDSWDSIAFADGTLAPTPRATCELQGYVYDAKVRTARLAREVWNDPRWAEQLEREAADLKRRFNEDFWIERRGFFALALDGQKRQVDSLTSNIGHLLWSGIADEDKAAACVRHLLGDDLFSGWGIRTMATTEGSYNPIGYHVGTVWPHDTSLIAWGLRRYGYRAEAARVCRAMLEAADLFKGRLPEAFAGYRREQTQYPVEYPTACSPQAWATAAPLLLVRTLLGLDSDGRHLIVDPAIPEPIGQLGLLDVPGCWGKMDAFGRARALS